MKTEYKLDHEAIISILNINYSIHANNISFLPKGDIAYAYIVTCGKNIIYFLKIFDKAIEKATKALDFYLPLTFVLYQKGYYANISYPIANKNGTFQVDVGNAIFVLFHYIEGKSPEDAYPFSKDLLKKVAEGIAQVHNIQYFCVPSNAKVETFQIPSEDTLLKILHALEAADQYKKESLQTLKEYIVPRKNVILSFFFQLKQYQKAIWEQPKQMVLTHGDIWGGNLMIDAQQNLHIVDWESAMFAPPEADLRHYLFEEFDYFLKVYMENIKNPPNLNANIFGFYLYRSHLSNLTNWMMRMLYFDQSLEQDLSDFECVTVHCMDRWDSVQEKMRTLAFSY